MITFGSYDDLTVTNKDNKTHNLHSAEQKITH